MIDQNQVAVFNSGHAADHERELGHVMGVLARCGVDAESVIARLEELTVAVPSWALGTGGTRFGRFPIGGEPRTTQEKIDDVAALNLLTRANEAISLQVPWDDHDDPVGLREYAAARGVTFDAMNSSTFPDSRSTTWSRKVSYKFGSLANVDAGVRRAAVEHNQYVIDLGVKLGSSALMVWLADGTSHPGQADFGQFERVADGLRAIHDHLPQGWRMFTERKPCRLAFYSTVNQDWGSSLLLAQAAGEKAACLVDLSHHPHLPSTSIEQIVSWLAMVGRLGGFHLNGPKYGNDLTTGAIRPFQLFLIFCNLVAAGGDRAPDLTYMIGQSHNLKDPLEGLLQSTEALIIAYAQALIVDREALRAAQDDNDPALAQELLQRAFHTDVRPLVADARWKAGGALALLACYRASGYRQKVIAQRSADTLTTGLRRAGEMPTLAVDFEPHRSESPAVEVPLP